MWKKIPNTEFYYANEYGQIKSVAHSQDVSINGHKSSYIRKGKILKPTLNSYGYPCVAISIGGKKQKVVAVHRLIAITFLPEPNKCQTQINHIDGDKTNNNVSNLEWCTPSENLKHAFAMGLNKGSHHMRDKFNEKHHRSIPINMCDLSGNIVKTFPSIMQACRELNLSEPSISACINGKRKTYNGYIWKKSPK